MSKGAGEGAKWLVGAGAGSSVGGGAGASGGHGESPAVDGGGLRPDAVERVLDDWPEPVYCASEKAIIAATVAYALAAGVQADAKGLAAAMVAAHAVELGLDRSVCLRDLVDAPERSINVTQRRRRS